MPRKTPETKASATGVIRADEAYTRTEFLTRMGRSAGRGGNLSDMESDGLPVCEVGGRSYVLGSDAIAWLASKRRSSK